MRLSPILGFLGRSDETPDAPIQGSGVMPPNRTDVVVTEDTALSLVNVYRAVQVLQVAAKQLTLDAWRGREPIEPRPAVVRQPDINLSLGSWTAEIVASLALTGDAYWRVTRNDRGPVNIEVLDPHLAHPDKNGTLEYDGKTLQPGEFEHLKLMRRAGRLHGLGPIQAARAELRGAIEQRNYGSEWMTSGDVPTGVLKSEQHLTPSQAAEYRDQWKARDEHNIAVLGAGLDYRPILISPEDAQFIETRRFSKAEIATLFGIPSRLLLVALEGGSMTYANLEQDDLAFIRWTLMDYLSEIEDALTRTLPGSQSARFNLDALVRPDITTRYKAHKIGLDAGFLTIEEVRAIEGLAPLTAKEAS